jgi:hypothetical protein
LVSEDSASGISCTNTLIKVQVVNEAGCADSISKQVARTRWLSLATLPAAFHISHSRQQIRLVSKRKR